MAIAHDYLNQFGGAERVALELARTWPGAPLYTSLYRPGSTFPGFGEVDVRTSPLQRLPVDASFRALAPLYPLAFRALGEIRAAVTISSSSGWAHGIRTAPGTLHIVYCHTPARWLYRADEHLGRALGPRLLSPLAGPLRAWDRAAARRAGVYVANCENVRRRISEVYGRESTVIHPPVDVDWLEPRARGERLLVVSRLLPYKRVELIVRAASRAGIGLDVVGLGPALDELRELAGPSVRFLGRVDDAAMKELLEGCRMLCMAGVEDFGMAPVEANAAGKPVLAFAAGGVLESQREGLTAAFFRDLTPEAVIDGIRRVDALDSSPEALAANARRFSVPRFREQMRQLVERELQRRAPSS